MFLHMDLMVLMVGNDLSKLGASDRRSNIGKRTVKRPQTVLLRPQTVLHLPQTHLLLPQALFLLEPNKSCIRTGMILLTLKGHNSRHKQRIRILNKVLSNIRLRSTRIRRQKTIPGTLVLKRSGN